MPPVKVLPRDCPAAEADGRPCSCGYVMYIGYNYQEQYPTRWDKVLRAAVEIMSPTYVEPEGGYPAPHTKMVPGTPPCLQKHGVAVTAISGDAAQNLKSEVESEVKGESKVKGNDVEGGGETPVAAASDSAVENSSEGTGAATRGRGGKAARLRTAQTKMQLQQQEIDSLVHEVDQLKGALHAKQPATEVADEVSRTTLLAQTHESMGQLRSQAVHLLSQIKRREARSARSSRGRSLGRAGGKGEEAVLVSSMTQLAQDMHNINGRVNKLTNLVEIKDKPKAPHAVDMAHPAEDGGKSSAEVKQLQAEMGKFKHEARAAKQELKFEQSIPSAPSYSHHEADHTTPLFGKGGRNCGTLCKLKQLVKKTRNNISKELDSALN